MSCGSINLLAEAPIWVAVEAHTGNKCVSSGSHSIQNLFENSISTREGSCVFHPKYPKKSGIEMVDLKSSKALVLVCPTMKELTEAHGRKNPGIPP